MVTFRAPNEYAFAALLDALAGRGGGAGGGAGVVGEGRVGGVVIRAPFPWFGGKSRAAHLVWPRFGDAPNYIEPFAGSLAVLFNRPGWDAGGWSDGQNRIETVNDKDCFVSNFFRALQADPGGVAQWADWPVNECDLHARHLWLVNQSEFVERMKTNPDYYDVKIAGWWVWGICQWIGGGWCDLQNGTRGGRTIDGGAQRKRPHLGNAGRGINRPSRQLPHLGDAGRGINRPSRQLPHLGDAGRGINRPSRKLPHLGDAGRGINRPSRKLPHLGNAGTGINRPSRKLPHLGNAGTGELYDYMNLLAARLRRVRVCCGDFMRVLGPTPTFKQGLTAVFLDPPYSAEAGRDDRLYAVDDLEVAHRAREWAIENGDNPLLRIALCGYEGEYEMPESWERVAWKAGGGYSSQNGNGNDNPTKERIWFSQHCLKLDRQQQLLLFEVIP